MGLRTGTMEGLELMSNTSLPELISGKEEEVMISGHTGFKEAGWGYG